MDPFADPLASPAEESLFSAPTASASTSTSPTLIKGYTTSQKTTLTIKCHDPTFKSVSVFDQIDPTTPLFTVTSKGATSFSWRRNIFDRSGEKLFELRHRGYAMKNDWVVEKVDAEGKVEKVASLKHVSLLAKNKSDLDMTIHSSPTTTTSSSSSGGSSSSQGEIMADEEGVVGERDQVVEIRARDRSALTTVVKFAGVEIATIKNTEANDVTDLEGKGLDRTVWEASVDAGVDLCLVLVAVLCVAEMEHVWRQ